MQPRRISLPLVVVLALVAPAWARVTVYPAPSGSALSKQYTVRVDGKPVDVYQAPIWNPSYAPSFGGPYSFAYFDFSGCAEVEVTSRHKSLKNVAILPESWRIKPGVSGNTLTFSLDAPCQLSIEPEAKNGPLLLFANPIEADRPDPNDPKVRYFGPGIHKPGLIELRDGQTLYLAGGAIVKGGVHASGSNIRIAGRGILDGGDWERFKGPGSYLMHLDRCKNVSVEGIILKDSWSWVCVNTRCDGVTIENIKICSSRCENNDGIGTVNSRHVAIANCFVRSDDDCITTKGMDDASKRPVDDVIVSRCVLWTDRAHVWRIGCECRAEAMRNLIFRNIDVIHFCNWAQDGPMAIILQPAEDMLLENVRFEDIRIHGEGQRLLLEIRPYPTPWAKKQTPGRVRGCIFKDIVVSGQSGKSVGRITVQGPDPQHTIEDVVFQNVVRYGKPVLRDSPEVDVLGATKGISFVGRE